MLSLVHALIHVLTHPYMLVSQDSLARHNCNQLLPGWTVFSRSAALQLLLLLLTGA